MDFVPLAAALALTWKITDLMKYVAAGRYRDVVTQVVTWLVGVLVIILLANTDFAGGIEMGGKALSDLNLASLLLIGLSVASGGSVLYDYKKAFDNTDSAKVSSLPVPTRHHDEPRAAPTK